MDKTDQAETVVSQVFVENEKAEAPQKNLLDRVGVLLALLELYVAWGSGYLGVRLALESIPVFLMSGIRFILAGGILYGYLRARRVPNPCKAEWVGAAIVGLLLPGMGSGGVAFAEQWIATGLAAVALGAVPLWIALFIGFTGDWPTQLEWLGLLLGFAGIVLLNLEHGMWATPIGAIALVLVPICWALGSALSTRLRLRLPVGLMGDAAQMLVAGVALLIVGLLLHEQVPHHLPTPRSLVALAYLIVFASLVAYPAYGYLLRKVRPALATSYAYVNPAVALLLGVVLAGEHVTLIGVLAMIVILTGVALVSLGKGRRSGD